MNFKQYLSEMPITAYNLRGDWSPTAKNKYGYNAQDAAIVGSDKGSEKIKKLWSNSKEEFDFYFVRQKNAWKHLEHGEASSEWVKENLGMDIEPREDAITIIFTNNRAGEKIPMTAWTIAHRLGHAIRRDQMYEEYGRTIEKDFRLLLDKVYQYNQRQQSYTQSNYGYGGGYGGYDRDNYNKDQLTLKGLVQAVGTMKSARQNNIRNFAEFTHELIAQYIITGKIKFNPLPKFLITKRTQAWGRPNNSGLYSRLDAQALADWNDTLEQFASKYEYTFDDLFSSLLGRIFVM